MNAARSIAMAALLIMALEVVIQLPLRARYTLATYAAVLALLVWSRRREIFAPGPLRVALGAGFAISVAPVLAGLFLGHEDPFRVLLLNLEPTLIGWCAVLVLLPLLRDTSPDSWSGTWTPKAWHAALFIAGAFAVHAVAHQLAVQHLAIVSDEVVFLAQSRWMHFPQVAWPVDADIAPFFRMRKVDYLHGHMYGMYPPGWPALLAAFRYVGLEWWSIVIVGSVSVVLTYLIGARLKGSRVGALAAVLLATSQMFLMNLAGYMSHGAGMVGLLGATLCLLVGIENRKWRRVVPWVVAGILFGFVVTARPLTGLAIGLSVSGWMLVRAWRVEPRSSIAMAACVAIGGLLPAWFFIKYNMAVFGKPIALGHELMHPGLYALGFGQRGFRVLDENLEWVPFSFYHGPLVGLRYLVRRLAGLNTTFVPVGMLVPIAALAITAGFRIRWPLVAAFAILPVAYFFYWDSSIRHYIELLPFVLLAVAAMLVVVHDRWPRLAWGLVGTVLASQAIVALPWRGTGAGHRPWTASDYGRAAPGRWATLMAADSLAREHGRLLLFSREQTRFDIQIDRLYVFNGDGFNGRILVARDLGPRNAELISRFPDRVPFLVDDQGRDKSAIFTRIVP